MHKLGIERVRCCFRIYIYISKKKTLLQGDCAWGQGDILAKTRDCDSIKYSFIEPRMNMDDLVPRTSEDMLYDRQRNLARVKHLSFSNRVIL